MSQLIIATSYKYDSKTAYQDDFKRAIELKMLTKMISDNIDNFANNTKEGMNNMEVDNDEEEDHKSKAIIDFEDFAEYLLQNSFSSDHYCRYESQQILYTLATKFFTVVNQISQDDLSQWILALIRK